MVFKAKLNALLTKRGGYLYVTPFALCIVYLAICTGEVVGKWMYQVVNAVL
ncbi:hypothetical protein KSF73_00955 [Burkholderiaceae bacterium DAT-1]|nr:hypothetical protein [Burkholderiaceae bacterium DAT-1]